ncbi:MAG: DUF1576 domain-containing protein [Spirochaetes bacterium]|nr:DUF1576 domain-containing protein [Spirochaetota bacterium]
MSESNVIKERYTANFVWGLFVVFTVVYGIIVAIIEHGSYAFMSVIEGLIAIYRSPSVLLHDYFAIAGVGATFLNSAMSVLLVLGAFKFAKLPLGGPQMGVLGLVMGFALLGKNPINMFPILLGAYIYSLYKKEPFKNHVTLAGFSTCLAPVVNSPIHIPEIVAAIGTSGAVILGVSLGLFVGFVINSMGAFIKKSHEGLNLYNIGWGAGLISMVIAAGYSAVGIERFGPGTDYKQGYSIYDAFGASDYFNTKLIIYLVLVVVFFFVMSLLAGGRRSYKLPEILYMKADDNLFYAKYGSGPTFMAMGCLALMSLTLILIFQVHLNAPIIGAIISMIGWGGFGKAVANCAAIISGVILGAIGRFLLAPGFLGHMTLLHYFSTQDVIWSSAFWGTCLSPMAKYFGWRWALLIGLVHFVFVLYVAPFHKGMNLYNNGLAAGLVCLVMIPLIRSFDKAGKYPPRAV